MSQTYLKGLLPGGGVFGDWFHRPWYAVVDVGGNEVADVQWWRVGRRGTRWFFEFGKWGAHLRLGLLFLTVDVDSFPEDWAHV